MTHKLTHGNQHSQHPKKHKKQPETRKKLKDDITFKVHDRGGKIDGLIS